jgi:hypothetical protein
MKETLDVRREKSMNNYLSSLNLKEKDYDRFLLERVLKEYDGTITTFIRLIDRQTGEVREFDLLKRNLGWFKILINYNI